MSIEENDIIRIAQLARIKLKKDQISGLKIEISGILELIEQLHSCQTNEVDPMAHPSDISLALREDAVTEANQREELQNVAPEIDRGLYLVPKVID